MSTFVCILAALMVSILMCALGKLLELDCGYLLSWIIEHDKFEKLFEMADYFFLADINRAPQPPTFEQIGDEYEYAVFQVSRIFISILSDLKQETTEFMYEKLSNYFSEQDVEKKQFLIEKVAHTRDTANYLLQQAENSRKTHNEQIEKEFELWKNSDEYKAHLRTYRAVSDYVAQESCDKKE